ncbi:MAG: hypothetical protein NZM43_11885 [Saprospiraceae bacterium]|nr:hypothetical protein [Saprospiraceae bacterium]MDW8485010.1 hypothetical protein [Saprospiraceae bacterium]
MRRWLALSLPWVVWCACNSYYYAPNTLYTPHLIERHDAELGICGLRGSDFSGFEFHGTYAFTNHFALMANHLDVRGRSPSQDRRGNGRLSEAALGVYFPLRQVSNTVFVGAGTGQVFNEFPKGSRATLKFHRYFGQYGISVEQGALRIGTGIRLNYLHYREGHIDYRVGESDVSKIILIEENSPFIFPEFSVNLRIGSRPVWANLCSTIVEHERAKELGWATQTIGLGLLLEVDHFWRAERPKK